MDSEFNDRGTGRTTRQILAAPQRSFYVCPNSRARSYTRSLAAHLGRSDLWMVDPDWLDRGACRGLFSDQVTIDHSVELTVRQKQQLNYLDTVNA